jgi:tRNA 5-methylaminomethyl-2-thiouridine biosynthesis bifunctional protein
MHIVRKYALTMTQTQSEPSAIVDWQDGQPVSALFGDVYFSRESGIAETRHVFLQNNRLRERWQTLSHEIFTIGETGFGTGLNFLCAWQLWREVAPAHARLHFVSTEKFPLPPEELERALALWPELAALSRLLLGQYKRIVPGWQRVVLDGGRVTLTLLIGDARETLPQLEARVDAWFLDGFAPAKNPDMWQQEIFNQLARLSAPGCTVATFTSAGFVRRGLQAAGYTMEKVPGYGNKWEMLHGELAGAVTTQPGRKRQAVIIGGGIAGASSAYALAARGWQVALIERHAALAQEASGNPQGVLYPRLSGHDIPLSRVALDGFLHTLRLAKGLLEKGRDWDDCGLLQQAFNAREAKRCEEVALRALPTELVHPVNAAEASELTGLEMPHGGLWFPHGGWIHPPAFCRALASHSNIQHRFSCEPLTLRNTLSGWQVLDHKQILAEAPVVIVCTANDTLHFAQTAHLPLEPVRGQITQINATQVSQKLKAVVCTEGYIGPAREGVHCVGASFSPSDSDPALRVGDHAQNLDMLRELSPALYQSLGGAQLDPTTLAGRASLRCAAPDYLPMAGQLLDPHALGERYEVGSRKSPDALPWFPGLYVNTAHGSKGLLTAPLCAELIAALLENEPLPMDSTLARALDPNRFVLRERGLKRLVGAAIGIPG